MPITYRDMPCHANLTSTVREDDGVAAAAGALAWKKDVSSAPRKKTL